MKSHVMTIVDNSLQYKEKVICKSCNVKFISYICSKIIFCSKKCHGKFFKVDNNHSKRLEVREKISLSKKDKKRPNVSGKNNYQWKEPIEFGCKICSKILLLKPWEVQRRKYCSNKCHGVDKRGKRPNHVFLSGDLNIAKRPEVREKLRESVLKRMKEVGGPFIGRNEKRILDEFAKKIGYKIMRQYIISGYALDGYIPELNLAIEIDEKYHFDKEGNLKEKDIIRQKEIQNKLNCEFLRIKD